MSKCINFPLQKCINIKVSSRTVKATTIVLYKLFIFITRLNFIYYPQLRLSITNKKVLSISKNNSSYFALKEVNLCKYNFHFNYIQHLLYILESFLVFSTKTFKVQILLPPTIELYIYIYIYWIQSSFPNFKQSQYKYPVSLMF